MGVALYSCTNLNEATNFFMYNNLMIIIVCNNVRRRQFWREREIGAAGIITIRR